VTLRQLLLVPVVALTTGACATRTDVQVLQQDMAVMRAESASSDSSLRAQMARLSDALAAVSDSLRVQGARVGKFQGDVQGSLYALQQQLIQVQELTGQSQRRIQQLRADLEARGAGGTPGSGVASATSPGPAARGDTAASATVSSAAPGPNQLYQLSLDQLRRGSNGAARAGFEELVRLYPTADVAGDAQFYIAEAYAAEGNMTAADSAYATVVRTYPTSPRAPTALYKNALSMRKAGRTREARQALESLVQSYPRSDEAELAREQLRSPR
jgi:tol-pal system protein YbgF